MTEEFATTTEIVQKAYSLLAPPVWDYVAGGGETETTVRRNRDAIGALAFRARILRNVATIDTSRELLGARLRIPYILAPVGSLQSLVDDGAAASVRGARTFGTLPVVSSVAQPALEVCAAAAEGPKWFQLYVRGDFAWVTEMVRRVREARFDALVLTVDTAYYSRRERQIIRRWLPAGRRVATDEHYQAALDWETVERIREIARLPIVIKGIQTSEDATLALERGIDVVWVSNHGGRQLDHSRGTLDVLPEVVAAVGGRKPIVVDGGFMRGTDVLKAIALGATAVATGRLHALALGAGGEAGLVRMLELLELEMTNAMGLLGVASLDELNASYVTPARPLASPPGAFPFLPPEIRL